MRRHLLLLSIAFVTAGRVAEAEPVSVQFVDPQSGRLRATPVTQAQRDAHRRIEGQAMPYAQAETHVLADGTVRVRLGKALNYSVQARSDAAGASSVVCDQTTHAGHAHSATASLREQEREQH